MAKYSIISLILTDLCQYFSYSTCFKEFSGDQSASKNSQVQRVPKFHLGGGDPISSTLGRDIKKAYML